MPKPTAKKSQKLTEFHLLEIEKCLFDFKYFITQYVFIQTDANSELFSLRDYQVKALDTIHENPCSIVLAPRQSGKTQMLVAYLLWRGMFNQNEVIGVSSYRDSLAIEIIARFQFAYDRLPIWLRPEIIVQNKHDLAFSNNSRIISSTTTARTFRGFSLTCLLADEFSFVKNNIAEDFWSSVLPALTAGDLANKRVIITSTPQNSEDLFATIWFGAESGESMFVPIRVYNEEVPGRDAEFKRKILTTMTEAKYRRDFDCVFESETGTLVSSRILESIKPKSPVSTHDGMSIFVDTLAKRSLLIACDVSEGIGGSGNYSAVQVFDKDTLEQVAEFKSNTLNLTDFTKYILNTLNFFKKSQVSEIFHTIEGNPIGQSIISLIKNSTHPVLNWDKLEFISGRKTHGRGILMTSASKATGCARLKDLLESHMLTIYSKSLISELKFFVKKGASFSAESGKKDDLVAATIIMVLLLIEVAKLDEGVWDKINKINMDISSEESESSRSFMPFVF